MQKELMVLNEERNVSLTAYLQPTGGDFMALDRRPAVLILPGGGYHGCSDREADPVAYPYLKAGYHAFILRYSVNAQAVWPNPLSDYEQAMALICERAGEWHVAAERIAVIGFSAGGHLAACAAVMSEHRPAAAILGYPVIDGDCVHDYLLSAPDVSARVDAHTCPCFVFATRTDNLVPVQNAVHLISALCENGISFESHIYSNGPHGLSTGDASINDQPFCDRYPAWVEDSISWLSDVMGGMSAQGLTAPRFGPKLNGNRERTLNLDCTIRHLAEHPQGKAILDEVLCNWQSSIPAEAARVMTLRESLTYAGADSDSLRAIGERLGGIENVREA